jgi:hypothetical protein
MNPFLLQIILNDDPKDDDDHPDEDLDEVSNVSHASEPNSISIHGNLDEQQRQEQHDLVATLKPSISPSTTTTNSSAIDDPLSNKVRQPPNDTEVIATTSFPRTALARASICRGMRPGAFYVTPGCVQSMATTHSYPTTSPTSIENDSYDNETVTAINEGDIENNNYYQSSSSCLIQAELVVADPAQQQIPTWNSIQQAQVIEPVEEAAALSLQDPNKALSSDDSNVTKQKQYLCPWNPGTKWVILMMCVTIVIAVSCVTYLQIQQQNNGHEKSLPCKPRFTKTVCYEIFHEKKKQSPTGISNITVDNDAQVQARLSKEFNCMAPKMENKSICQVMFSKEHDATKDDLNHCRSFRSLNETCGQIIHAIQDQNVKLFDKDYTTEEALHLAQICTNATLLCEILEDVFHDSDDRSDREHDD